MQDIHFVSKVNKAKLFLACASGRHIKKATLTCRKAERNSGTSGVHAVGRAGLVVSIGGSLRRQYPVDQVSLNFAKIEISTRTVSHRRRRNVKPVGT
jgi:type VI secretion system secreted protein Hcp